MKRKLIFFCFLLVAKFAEGQALSRGFGSGDTLVLRTGRGLCVVRDGALRTREASAWFGDSTWTDYDLRFSARAPDTASMVQIWAGFRARDRHNFYSLGIRGGEQNSIYLARRGAMGRDEFLALRPLGFHPVPGKWYALRVMVNGPRIRIFCGGMLLPLIDITDKNSRLLPAGKVILGGGWVETEYRELVVSPAGGSATGGPAGRGTAPGMEEIDHPVPDKEGQRKQERKVWAPVELASLTRPRTELSLNGRWLFMPAYSGISDSKAASPHAADEDWHIMPVPAFWNPIRIWLHGETFGPHAKGASDNYFQQETHRCESYSFDYAKTSQAWYRQWIVLPAAIKSKDCELVFDAVSKVAEVFINGKRAGSHIGMFGEFRVDGTGLFVAGKNLVAVKVSRDYGKAIADADKIVDVAVSVPVTNKMVHDLPHGFYGADPAGIWQPVKLVITDPVKITDVFIQPSLTGAKLQVTVKNSFEKPVDIVLSTAIRGKPDGRFLYKDSARPMAVKLAAGEEKVVEFSVGGLQPRLWSPQEPNLYDFIFRLQADGGFADEQTVCSGFRTFESHDGYFWLNGRRYWLRGANQTPFALEPDSAGVADRFFQLMKAGNMEVTRTHTAPYNECWMEAADRNGIGISYEGTWPWLMLAGSMPDTALITLWADEFIDLLKKYRNHPSLLFWTVNNEMKFYDNDPDPVRARLKMRIISAVVKRMRGTDPTRPICFDSNYRRNVKKFGADLFLAIDDGDMDDIHSYINWYDYTIFKQFKGEFQNQYRNEGRPLISQEMSTGYPNGETGHATRFYTIVHQTPQALIGDLAYENCDPKYFLTTHAFITGELAEAFRRSNEKAAGILHFALITWFRNVYDRQRIEPYPVFDAMKRALQPVLVSAELWGRHFYAGEKVPARVCVVNDATDGRELSSSMLDWRLVAANGAVLASGQEVVPAVPYYGRQWVSPVITVPPGMGASRVEAKLVLSLKVGGRQASANEYGVLLAGRAWSAAGVSAAAGRSGDAGLVLVDFTAMRPVLDTLGIRYTQASTITDALGKKAALYIFSGLDSGRNCTAEELLQLRSRIRAGARVLLLDAPGMAKALYPDCVRGWIIPTDGDIVNMEVPESPVFEGLEPLDLRYFNNNQREVPTVCRAALQTGSDPRVELLASQLKVHGYVEGDMEKRAAFMEKIKGFPVVTIRDGGTLLVSVMALEKGVSDPVAGRLLSNMIGMLVK